MTIGDGEAIFEAPAWHETESFEDGEGPIGQQTAFEWEQQDATHYGSRERPGDPEAEWAPLAEWAPEAAWEEITGEADQFIGRATRALGRAARRLAPVAVGALGGMIPGAGPLLGPLASAAVREGEMEAAAMEAQLFGPAAAEAEIGGTQTSYEAALTEVLAAEATLAESEAEAVSIISGTLPITISIMGGRRALRHVMPAMAQASGRLVRVLRRQGPAGNQLLRTMPAAQRRAVASLHAASRRGQPITGPLAVQAMAAGARSILADPRRLRRVVERNAVLRRRAGPPSPRRAAGSRAWPPAAV